MTELVGDCARAPKRVSVAVGFLALSVLASGCSSLINPHVTPDEYASVCARDGKGTSDLNQAQRCADAWIDKYRDAIGDQAALVQGTGLALIPATAAALAGC